MSITDRIERVVVTKYPIYLKDIPEQGIVKDCHMNKSIKNTCRNELRRKLATSTELIEKYETDLCLQ